MLKLCGQFNIDASVVRGDKSILHRALIFAAISSGKCEIRNLTLSEDILATVDCLRALGAKIDLEEDCATVYPITTPNNNVVLNCKNSGTTARLLAGLVAGLGVQATFAGDNSLTKRPMDRVLEPLTKLGANFRKIEGGLFQSLGGKLHGERICATVNSAQVKSAVLIAGLFAEGETTYVEQLPTRNHTELMLECLGANIITNGLAVTVSKSRLNCFSIDVPRDVSSMAFLVAAALIAGKQIALDNVLLNERRTGFLRVLQNGGANIRYANEHTCFGEKVGDIILEKGVLSPLFASTSDVCDAIDELPILASIALTVKGKHVFKDVCELQHKESNRVKAILHMAKICNQQAYFNGKDLTVISNGKLPSNPRFCSFNDHRIAMCEVVLCLVCNGGSVDEAPFEVSFPQFCSALGLNVLKLGLVGTDIANSFSPYLMEYLATKANVCCSYNLETLPSNAPDCDLFRVINKYHGLNVTMPFKTRVARLLNADCASVNIVGKNVKPQSTDGYGIVKALEQNNVEFANKPLWIIGAGGAANCCVETLLKYGCKIRIINRTKSRADQLTKKYNLSTDIETPYGVLSFVPECEFEQGLALPDTCRFVFIAAYKGKRGLKEQAVERGITVVDGLQMLYHQGAKSFSLWTDTPLQDDYNGFKQFIKDCGIYNA